MSDSPQMRRPHAYESSDARDRELFGRVRDGDGDAFGELVRQWWRPLVSYVDRMVNSLDAAEDIVQEAFVRLWERRTAWRADSAPRVVLYTICRNMALNRQRSQRARSRRLHLIERTSRLDSTTPLHVIEGEEFRCALEQAIASLRPRHREVVTLSRMQGLSRAEIADVTRLSPQTVANYLAMGMAALRDQLSEFLGP